MTKSIALIYMIRYINSAVPNHYYSYLPILIPLGELYLSNENNLSS